MIRAWKKFFSLSPSSGDKNRSQIKVNSQLGGTGISGEVSQWEVPVSAAIIRQRSESHVKQGKKPVKGENGASELTSGLAASAGNSFSVRARAKHPLVSKYGRKYSYRARLHAQVDHNESSVSGKNLQQNLSLDGHVNIQAGAKPSARSGRGRSFPLTRRQSTRTGEKGHKCPVCGKSFSASGAVPRHLRIHTGEKPYQCPQCEKCFTQRAHLMSHQTTHTGEKPFRCCECGRNFARRDKMTRHQKTHRGSRPYGCPECGRRFSQKDTLIRHGCTHKRD